MDVKGTGLGLPPGAGKKRKSRQPWSPRRGAVSLARLIQSQSNNRLQSGFRAYTNACNSTMQLTESLYTDTHLPSQGEVHAHTPVVNIQFTRIPTR